MNTPFRYLILAGSGVVGFAFGVWCARSAHEPPPSAIEEQMPTASAVKGGVERSLEDLFGAVVPAGREKNALARFRVLGEALHGVTEDQAVPLLERIDRLPKTDRDDLLHPVFARLCALYPAAVTPWVLRLPRSRHIWLDAYIEDGPVFSTWVRLVPEVAIPIAQQDPLSFAHAFAFRSSPGNGASEPATLGFDSLPTGPLRERAAALYAAHGYKDVASAWRVARAEVHGEMRLEVAYELADSGLSLYEADPAEILQMLAELAPELPAGVFGHRLLNEMAARATSRIEPEDVADWTLRLPEALRLPAAVAAGSRWAENAPMDALAWARKNGVAPDLEIDDSSNSRGRRFSFLKTALGKAPDATVAWLAQLPSGAERARLVAYACKDRRLSPKWQAALRDAVQLSPEQ